MPRRRPPASGEMPSLAMAMRMRFRAFFVISTAALARGCWPSAVSSVMLAKGSFDASAEAPGLGAAVPGWSRVDIDIQTSESRQSAETRRPLEMSSLVCSGSDSSRGSFADVVLLLPVTDRRADGVLGQHRAVDLHWRKRELLNDVGVRNFECVFDGLALDPLGGERAGGDGRAAAEGLELGVLDDLGLGIDANLEAHDVAALRGADEAGTDFVGGLVELADVAGIAVMIDYLIAVCH